MKTFEDLRVFQAAMDLRVDIHRMTESFPQHELFGIVSQLRRAAGAVVRDIAEGQGRLSFGEWRLLLSHARGSRSKRQQTRAVGQMLAGLIRYVQARENAAARRPGNRQRGTGNR